MGISAIKARKGLMFFLIYAFLTLGALSMVIPYIWMLVTSIKPIEEIQTYPPSFLVHHPTTASYRELFSLFPIWRYLLNSFFVASAVTLCNVFFCSLAGYAFCKHRFWGRDKIFLLLLSQRWAASTGLSKPNAFFTARFIGGESFAKIPPPIGFITIVAIPFS